MEELKVLQTAALAVICTSCQTAAAKLWQQLWLCKSAAVSNVLLAACRRQLLPLRPLAPSALQLTTAERTDLLRVYR